MLRLGFQESVDSVDCYGNLDIGHSSRASLSSVYFIAYVGRYYLCSGCFYVGSFSLWEEIHQINPGYLLESVKIIFLPTLAFLTLIRFNLPSMSRSLLILMHRMSGAVSLSVLSERYDFYTEKIASLTLISSLGAIIYLNVWLFILGI